MIVLDVINCQTKWVEAIKYISERYLKEEDFVKASEEAITDLYAYDYDNVLFKPTKAVENRFRPTKDDALSYFVGNDNVDDGFTEDSGFAINSGKCWSNVMFKNHQIYVSDNIGIAMGVYEFTCARSKEVILAEYTMGYKQYEDGKMRIFLHHSSIPYSK